MLDTNKAGNYRVGLINLTNGSLIQPTTVPTLLPTLTVPPKFSCDSLSVPGYELFDPYTRGPEQIGNPQQGSYLADLKGDGQKELVRTYNDIQNGGTRYKPIMVKIFSGKQNCWQELFAYNGNITSQKPRTGNEVGDIQLLSNFWGNKKDVILVEPISTGYGSGFSSYLNFFTFQNGSFTEIDGPSLNELADYKFTDPAHKGREILVQKALWSDSDGGHFSPHRYQFYKYDWDGSKYVETALGWTKNKYAARIDQVLVAEPDAMFPDKSVFISADQALSVVDKQPDGFLFDKSLKEQMGIIADTAPTSQSPYWYIRIYSKNAAKNAGVLGTVSWAYVDARTGDFVCAWTEYGNANSSCMAGPPFN